MSNTTANPSSKKILALSAVAAIATLLFSIMGAPFLRVLSSSSRRRVFWGVGLLLVSVLFFVGLNVEGTFIGSVWSTLGAYSEIERMGHNWKNNFFVSLLVGALFSVLSTLIVFHAGLSTVAAETAIQGAVCEVRLAAIGQVAVAVGESRVAAAHAGAVGAALPRGAEEAAGTAMGGTGGAPTVRRLRLRSQRHPAHAAGTARAVDRLRRSKRLQ